MTYVYHALILAALLNIEARAACPISAKDVALERKALSSTLAMQKNEFLSLASSIHLNACIQPANRGISLVENQLQDSLNIQGQVSKVNFEDLGTKVFGAKIQPTSAYFTHNPTNGFKSILLHVGTKHPDAYLDPKDLQSGINLLIPAGSLSCPACLTSEDLEGYIHSRKDLKQGLGEYWNNLFSKRYTDEQLALLRYYEYVEINSPKVDVPVFYCTVVFGRNH